METNDQNFIPDAMPHPPQHVTGLDYAGFWRRFAAHFIDWTIQALFLNEIYWQIYRSFPKYPWFEEALYDLFREFSHSYEYAHQIAEAYALILLTPISIIVLWCYYAGMESSPLKATIGKFAVGIYVTDTRGERIGFGKATGRHFAKIISGIILGIGYMMAGFTIRKQALHDTIADCLVLKK